MLLTIFFIGLTEVLFVKYSVSLLVEEKEDETFWKRDRSYIK